MGQAYARGPRSLPFGESAEGGLRGSRYRSRRPPVRAFGHVSPHDRPGERLVTFGGLFAWSELHLHLARSSHCLEGACSADDLPWATVRPALRGARVEPDSQGAVGALDVLVEPVVVEVAVPTAPCASGAERRIAERGPGEDSPGVDVSQQLRV